MSLWLVRAGVSVIARADVLPVDDMMGKLREVAGEEAAAYIEAFDAKSFQGGGQSLTEHVQENVELFSEAYAELVKFVEEEEKKIIISKRKVDPVGAGTASPSGVRSGSRAPIAGSAPGVGSAATSIARWAGQRSFESDMILSLRQRDEDEPEWAWVRKDNHARWQNFEVLNSVTPTPPTGYSRKK